MVTYECPLCGRQMERDLVLFLEHTNSHVIDKIKKSHPDWVAEDGACKPCVEYYKRQISGDAGRGNLGPKGRRRRILLGAVMLGVSLILWLALAGTQAPRGWRLVLIMPLFLAMLGLLQARENTCAVMAERGILNWDQGEAKIDDADLASALRRRGRKIWIATLLAAAILAGVMFFLG